MKNQTHIQFFTVAIHSHLKSLASKEREIAQGFHGRLATEIKGRVTQCTKIARSMFSTFK
eukprot:2271373-Amphidinium_carterae.1